MKYELFGNNVLVEAINDDEDIRINYNEDSQQKQGIIISYSVDEMFLTASTSIRLPDLYINNLKDRLQKLVNEKTVIKWENFASDGQTFTENGKVYAVVPWWRILLSVKKG